MVYAMLSGLPAINTYVRPMGEMFGLFRVFHRTNRNMIMPYIQLEKVLRSSAHKLPSQPTDQQKRIYCFQQTTEKRVGDE